MPDRYCTGCTRRKPHNRLWYGTYCLRCRIRDHWRWHTFTDEPDSDYAYRAVPRFATCLACGWDGPDRDDWDVAEKDANRHRRWCRVWWPIYSRWLDRA